uniref:ARID domain-containing protein n=1 Tax=Macrostomum lignano TaxID=282301 RepID=A0A1I8FDH0_9PLAT
LPHPSADSYQNDGSRAAAAEDGGGGGQLATAWQRFRQVDRDENKVETLIEDEALQSKEAGQSQQLEENIQEEQDEEEEDPDIGVESFVSGDISRPCPESEAILEEHLSDYRKLKQNSQAMLVFLHCLLARGAESGQPGSSLWPVYFDWLAEDWSGATGCTKPKHSRRYAYEIYSTFLHEESPLSLLASSNSDADASRQPAARRSGASA